MFPFSPVIFFFLYGTASIKKLQEQNESHQASTAKMAEGMTLALEKKDEVSVRVSVSHQAQYRYPNTIFFLCFSTAGVDGEVCSCGKG